MIIFVEINPKKTYYNITILSYFSLDYVNLKTKDENLKNEAIVHLKALCCISLGKITPDNDRAILTWH